MSLPRVHTRTLQRWPGRGPGAGSPATLRHRAPVLITLTFATLAPDSQVLVRAPFFRICADSTLRGPDSTIVATYSAHMWRLGLRSCREFHCNAALYLRVTNQAGQRERLGPYEFVRAAEGALFASGQCLGTYSRRWHAQDTAECWQEVTLLSAAAETAVRSPAAGLRPAR